LPAKRRVRGGDESSFQPRVAIKFGDQVQIPMGQDSGQPIEWPQSLDRSALIEAFGDLRLLPLIESMTPVRLAELIDLARSRDPEYDPASFSAWYQVICPPDSDPDEVAKGLRGLTGVEAAYVMRPGPPPVNPSDDPRSTNQGYLDSAPNGIDARYAWGFAGGDGAGVGFVDMEQGWNLNHEDLAAAGISVISGINNAYRWHGTSVLGEVRMVDNTVGGVGIAPTSVGRVVSQQRSASSYNTADAILDAAANMAFGDVLLLEAQEYDPVGGAYLWPVEIVDGTFDAIRLATALGVVVVEAGCNGGYDLDAYTNAAGRRIFDRSSADFRDSGAIMVGAGSSASPHTRLSFSNYGSRIDCYAWGENIDTTTTNDAGTDDTSYTTGFGGTSGASPIVTGAAVIVQALAQASLGYRFSPRELRGILAANGTASANPAADRIGVMPDLAAIIINHKLNLAPDLYLRDYVSDLGNPTVGTVSASPDIILRQTAVANPQTSFGPGSGTENDPALSDQARTNHDNFVYLRVLNRGGSAAANASVDVYWSPPATLVTPNLWHLIGTATLASVPTGNVLTVSDGLTWASAEIPAPGHYCFVAVAGNAEDPKPNTATFSTFDQYLAYVRNNNNIAWRNFDVVMGPPSAGAPPGFYQLAFIIPGAFDTSHRFVFEAIGRLPQGSRAFLQAPAWFAEALRAQPSEIERGKRATVRIPLHPHGFQRIGEAVLHAESAADCQLLVSIPKEHRGYAYEFSIRQLYEGEHVGVLTWRFNPLIKDNKASRKHSRRGRSS
jgi:subtilase family protein